jgi:hypothetical protein
LSQLYVGGLKTRDTKLKKIIIPNNNPFKLVHRNWDMWGAKGLLSTHMMFEGGAALIMIPMRHHFGKPNGYELGIIEKHGFIEYFKRTAREVAMLKMYERFYETGWNAKLAREIRDELAPRMVKAVTLAWHSALVESEPVKV